MTTQYGRKAIPPTDRHSRPPEQLKESADSTLDAVPGLLDDIAMAAAKIYYLTAGTPRPQRRPSTVDR
jgi:hypothetical protein